MHLFHWHMSRNCEVVETAVKVQYKPRTSSATGRVRARAVLGRRLLYVLHRPVFVVRHLRRPSVHSIMGPAEQVGYAGDRLVPSDVSTALHRAGGPVCIWQDVPQEALKRLMKCKTCDRALALVHQVYAPLRGSIPDRILLMFVCLNASCCSSANAFRAVRCQLRPQSDSAHQSSQPKPAADIFGVVSWGKAAEAEKEGSGKQAESSAANDFSDLMRQMNDLEVQPTATPDASHQSDSAAQKKTAPAKPSRREGRNLSVGPELPSFKVRFEPSRPARANGLDDEYIQQLLRDYEQEAATALSEDAGSLVAESYEETDAYTQFVEDMAEAPYQCSRYGRELQALWPGEGGLPEVAACPLCGGKRSAELQVLAPMWLYMEEAATWHTEFSPESAEVDASALRHPKWDWASVIMLTCDKNCHPGDETWCVAEEEIVGFNNATQKRADRPPYSRVGAYNSIANSDCTEHDVQAMVAAMNISESDMQAMIAALREPEQNIQGKLSAMNDPEE